MTHLIILIDPDDENLNSLIQNVNYLQPKHTWVGCTRSSGVTVSNVIKRLKIPVSLFPGNFDQLKTCHKLAQSIFLPDPLVYNKEEIAPLLSHVSNYSHNELKGKSQFMNYIVLHPNCTAARKLGIQDVPSDTTILELLEQSKMHNYIYLEGGSRNQKASLTSRTSLIRTLRSLYPQAKLICGGGINTEYEIKTLKDEGVNVLISNALHRQPHQLERLLYLFEY